MLIQVRGICWAPLGWRCLFRNEVEEIWEEFVLDFQAHNQLPLIKVQETPIREFVSNWFN